MELGLFFGLIMFALLEVVRTQYEESYGIDPRQSVHYVVPVLA
jgi:hypothetical protein